MNTTVIYHSADYDGIFCREIARKFLGNSVNFIGWNFGETVVYVPDGLVYIMDLAPNVMANTSTPKGVIWIDHHKTAIEKFDPKTPGFRIDGVAACRLAWHWFSVNERNSRSSDREMERPFSSKAEFVDRIVREPVAVRMVGEYDVFDHRDPQVNAFQYGLRTEDNRKPGADEDGLRWDLLLNDGDDISTMTYLELLLHHGRIAKRYMDKVNTGLVAKRAWMQVFEGLKFLILNTANANSQTFTSLDVPETGHDALMTISYNGREWAVSMYHARHRTDLDLSEIAKRFGGGGHRGACGFATKTFPL